MSTLLPRTEGEPSHDWFVLHASEEIEETRQAIVGDALSLTKHV